MLWICIHRCTIIYQFLANEKNMAIVEIRAGSNIFWELPGDYIIVLLRSLYQRGKTNLQEKLILLRYKNAPTKWFTNYVRRRAYAPGIILKPVRLLGKLLNTRVAQRAGSGTSSIAKGLIDSKDPRHTLFCRETAFVEDCAFFLGIIFTSFDGSSNIFATAQ